MESYYKQFSAPLDVTQTVQDLYPVFLEAVAETGRILELTAYRTKVSDQTTSLNGRQLKVPNRLIDYELRGGFEGDMNNAK